MSDPSQALNSFVQSARRVMQKSRSEAESVDSIGTDWQEVEAGTLHDGKFLITGNQSLTHSTHKQVCTREINLPSTLLIEALFLVKYT